MTILRRGHAANEAFVKKLKRTIPQPYSQELELAFLFLSVMVPE